MNETNPAKIIIYTVLLIAAIALTVFAFTELDSIANNSSFTLTGIILGVIDAFIPIAFALLYFLINKTFGRVTAIFLLLIQIGLIIYVIFSIPMLEAIENMFIMTQAVLYVGVIITITINFIRTGRI